MDTQPMSLSSDPKVASIQRTIDLIISKVIDPEISRVSKELSDILDIDAI